MAGRDFVAGFLTRHSNLSLRKPEAIFLNRVYGLNKLSVKKYFENLAKVLDTYNQWWILGEASEAVASGPPFLKIPHVVSFCCIFF